MKILITGSAGFIGKTILRKLWYDHNVTGIDIHPTQGIIVDARDFFWDWDPSHWDLVIHCAAVVGGRQLVESPMAHAMNLEIDAALFQWAERAKPGRIVYVSSVAAYPAEKQNYRYALKEDDINLTRMAVPDELYGWAKLTGEFLASRSSVPVSIPRLFTVYGEGQDPIFPFANIMQQVRDRCDPVTVWGSGEQVRDFIHVDDVVNAILAMAKHDIDGPVNICTGRGIGLHQLVSMMTKAVKATYEKYFPEIAHLDKPEGLPFRIGDPARLNGFYVPEISLEEGIQRGLQ